MQLRIPRRSEDPKQAFFRRFRSNLPISLTIHNSTRLRLLTLDTPVSVLGTSWNFVRNSLFIGNRNCLGPPTVRRLFMLSSGSRRKGTPQRYTFKQDDRPARTILLRHELRFRYRYPTFQVQKYKSVSLSLPTIKKKLRND